MRLSPKEASLLGYLAERPGTTVSREELLREVWGYREGVMSRTLDTTVRTLRAKIEADRTTPSHVLTDPGGGYRFEPSRPAPATAGPPPITAQAPPMQEPNRFVGRVYDVSQIEGLYADPESGVRLVTLIGTAGVGKTRLARRVSRTMSQRGMFPGGVWLADLIGCTTPDDATHAVALAVADPEDAPRVDGEALGAQLAGLGQALLVLDNVDSVVEPVAGLVTRWLDRAPGLRVLVTSRERLRLRAEHCHALDPLSAAEAFELLLDRAQAASLALDAEGEACLEELARRLEGLPLALE
ncbi:MAG TPA: winged helix-turn-helix domain-containing protein, partial [Myxococcota bacterium]|nr:winged helix-turn-helix domain-containing protein [Myxococcota bacterium]